MYTHVFKEDTQMTNRHINRCSNITNHQKVQIKTTVSYHLTPIRIALASSKRITSVSEDVEKESFVHCWWDWKLVQPLWKT